MNSRLSSVSLSLFLLVGLALAIGLLISWFALRSHVSRASGHRARAGLWTALFGLAALVVVGLSEARRILESGTGPNASAGFARLASAVTLDPAPDRVQCLFVVSDRNALTPPREIHERIVDLPADPSLPTEFEVAELNTSCTVQWTDRQQFEALFFESRSRPWFGSDHSQGRRVLADKLRVDLGDGRAFALVGSDLETWPGLSLRLGVQSRFQILIRPLFPNDRLAAQDGAAARKVVQTALSSLPTMRALGSGPLPDHPIRRLWSEVNPLGLMVLLVGLALLLHRRVSLMRAAVLLAFIVVSLLSAASRADLWRGRALLNAPDPSVRVESAVRLASLRAFAPSASDELLDRFLLENVPEVRAALLAATLVGGNPLGQLETCQELLRRARTDSDPAVQAVLEQIENSRPEEPGPAGPVRSPR